jgi:hypothetical protein
MPLPPLTKDYFTVGGTQIFGVTLFTWGQARSPVYAAPHTSGGFTFSNSSHAYDYYKYSAGAPIRAVDAQGRLFRGTPYAAPGYNDYFDSSGQERFFFGSLDIFPTFMPGVGTGFDKDYESDILLGAVYVGTAVTVTVAADAFDGSDPEGQAIGTVAQGDVTSVTLAF